MRIDVIRRQQKAGRRAQTGQANAKAHRVHMVHINAHQLGAVLFFGNRANGAPQIGFTHYPQQDARDHQCPRKRHQLGQCNHGRADGDGGKGVGGVDGACV